MNTKDITLTRHAKQRLRERHDRWLIAYTNEREFEISCYELLDRAEFSKRHLNDTRFMVEMGEQFGYDKVFSFKVWKNVLFVIQNNVVTTVLDTDEHRTSRQFNGRVKRF